MSETAVRAEGLGKEFHIGALQTKQDTLGQQMIDMFVSPFRRAGRLLTGHASAASELDEVIWALRDISFDIKAGEAVAIIGRNGAGKSTLLKILSRITEPTRGKATIYGRIGSLLEVGTGFHPELTGRENTFLNGAILGMKRAEIERQFDAIVAFAEIEQFIDTPVKHYSSGMYVRLAFAVAAHLEPEILLVDEVLAVGDVAFQKKCLGKMDDVAQAGRTVLFVSHNMSLIQSLCQRGIFLDKGLVAYDGPVMGAIDAYLETLEQMEKTSVAERKDRQGQGQVRVLNIEIQDIDGHSTMGRSAMILKTGQACRFVFEVNRLIASISCLFVFFDHLGQRVALFKSDLPSPQDVEDSSLKTTFICELPQLLLLPGRYHLNVLIRGGGEWQDFVESALIFDVQAGEVDGRPMAADPNVSVIMPHRWRLPK